MAKNKNNNYRNNASGSTKSNTGNSSYDCTGNSVRDSNKQFQDKHSSKNCSDSE